jgi:diguanylate cyclase (GGDEF)-like protein/PAS domain S-box-containing protein
VRLQTFPVLGHDGTATAFIEIAEDITERKQMEEALRESEEKYRTILEAIEEGYYEVDLAGNLIFFNDSLCKIFGYPRDELMGTNNQEYMSPETAKRTYQLFNEVYKTGKPTKIFDWDFIKIDGSTINVEISISLMRDSKGEPVGFRGIVRDITERKQAEEALRQSEEKYRTIVDGIEDAYFENDLRGNFTFFNDSLCRMFGYARDELMGLNYRDYMDEENSKKVFQKYNRVYTTGEPDKEVNYEIIAKDGTKKHVDISISLIKNAAGKPVGFRGLGRDRTERKRAEEELEYMATHDSLTGLPNRTLFTDRLTMALAQARRSQKMLAVMLLDLDYFKDVNDSLGHSVGDQLLHLVGNRLTEVLRKGDTVSRVGGDEFLLLLPAIAHIEDAITIAQKILDAFRAPFVCGDHEIHITTSIGIAIYPDDGDDADTVMKNADIAMYRAKDKGRDSFQRYTPT